MNYTIRLNCLSTETGQDQPGLSLIAKSDIERCADLVSQQQSFLCPLHGSIGDLRSLVFTESEYGALERDSGYLAGIGHLMSRCSVVFIGTSLRDRYVIGLLTGLHHNKPLLGDGPHFWVTAEKESTLPSSFHRILYINEPHADHRSAIWVLDIIRAVTRITVDTPDSRTFAQTAVNQRSAYFISDLYPPGTWSTAATLRLAAAEESKSSKVVIGQGFVDAEMQITESVAMHDLVVGLVCFDEVLLPSQALSRAHALLGSARFWRLVEARAMRFVHWEMEPAVVYSGLSAAVGELTQIAAVQDKDGKPLTWEGIIRRHLRPAPGRDAEAERQFNLLTDTGLVYDQPLLAQMTRGAILHPSVRALLGLSDAFVPSSVPPWNVHPLIRLAHVVGVGATCNALAVPATKIPFGGGVVASVAFPAGSGTAWAEEAANYVLAGRFNADLGSMVHADPSVLDDVMRFRESQTGVELRQEILVCLRADAGAEFNAAVNAALHRSLSPVLLQKARDAVVRLFTQSGGYKAGPTAVWSDNRTDEDSLRLWRKRSAALYEQHCLQHKIGPYHLCPCESGEKAKFCCGAALSR